MPTVVHILTAMANAPFNRVSCGCFIHGAEAGWFVEEIKLLGMSVKEGEGCTWAALDNMKVVDARSASGDQQNG